MTEIEDRLAIYDLIARYAVLVDAGEFDALTELFTPDAVINFSAFSGPVGDPATIKEFLASTLPMFARTQHMMGLPLVNLAGDTATARTSCTNPMVMSHGDDKTGVWLIGLWYDDEFRRTSDGWRFTARNQVRCYSVTGLTDTPLSAT